MLNLFYLSKEVEIIQEGFKQRFPDGSPQKDPSGRLIWNTSAIFLTNSDFIEYLRTFCQENGLPGPTSLDLSLLGAVKNAPSPLPRLDSNGEEKILSIWPKDRPLRIALVSGAGGGLGDGILSAPAIEILEKKLLEIPAKKTCSDGRKLEIHVLNMRYRRLEAALFGLNAISCLKLLPISVEEFCQYDFYIDCSGMITDPDFNRTNLTDYVLRRFGIDPDTIGAKFKEPLLRITEQPEIRSITDLALCKARSCAGKRPLCAVIYKGSAINRRMSIKRAYKLIKELFKAGFMPVLIEDSPDNARKFIAEFDLDRYCIDLSWASRGYLHFFCLLAGMDAIVSVDTSAVHAGAGLGIPTVGIFSSIDHRLRVTYSPSVKAIQLEYSGKRCESPCGKHMPKAFISIKASDGTSLKYYYSYPCEEALDVKEMIEKAISRFEMQRSKARDPVEERRLLKQVDHEVRAWFEDKEAPCWSGLDPEEVVKALTTLKKTIERNGAKWPCPVCGYKDKHRKMDRILLENRYRCKRCGSDFFQQYEEAPKQLNLTHLKNVIFVPIKEEKTWARNILEAVLRAQTASANGEYPKVLYLGEEGGLLDIRPWPPLAENHGLDVLILDGVLDREKDPIRVLKKYFKRLRPDGLIIASIINRKFLRPGQYPFGPRWSPEGLSAFFKKQGLCVVWQGESPFYSQQIKKAFSGLPPLLVRNGPNEIIRVAGQEISALLANHLESAISETSGRGRFLLTLASKI